MRDILIALGHAIRSLVRPGVFVHLVWPGIVSTLLWSIVAWFYWTAIGDAIMGVIQGLGWVGNWIGASTWASYTVKLLMALTLLPLIYVTSVLLVSSVALPMMLDRVARRDYVNLEQRCGGSSMGSIGNTLAALLKYVVVIAISLPLWLIPGVALIVPLLATGWLNQRILGYDALMRHADCDELVRLRQGLRSQMLLLSGGTSLLGYVPVANIVAPAFSGLALVHFLLEALRRERHEHGGTS